jgi:5'-3' exoribonuclease 2
MSAADRLRAEMNGETVDGDDEGEETVTLERKDEEEKEEMEAGQARQVLEGQAEDEGVDEEVVQPALGTDEEEGEAAVPLEGEQTMDEGEEADGQDGSAERGVKRKADDVEDEEAEDGDDGLDAPPDIESDQPASKKKLKFNADGTVDGYEDDVRYDFLGVLPKSVN